MRKVDLFAALLAVMLFHSMYAIASATDLLHSAHADVDCSLTNYLASVNNYLLLVFPLKIQVGKSDKGLNPTN